MREPHATPSPSTSHSAGCGAGRALTDGRAIKEQGHAEEHAHTEGQDEGPPAAPAQGASVAGRADEGCEDEAEDGAQEPGKTVVLLRKACKTRGHQVQARRCPHL